ENVQDGVTGRSGNGMGLVSEPMHERAGASRKRVGNAGGNEHSAKWRVTAGNSLPDQNEIRLDIPMLDSERFSRSAHAAHDFVGDEKDPMRMTNFGYALRVTFRWSSRAQSRSDNWLKDEGRCGLGIAGSKERFQIISASKPAVRIFRAERTVIAKG